MDKESFISHKREALEIERSSLISDVDSIGPVGQVDNDFGSRKIILLRYPVNPVKKGFATF